MPVVEHAAKALHHWLSASSAERDPERLPPEAAFNAAWDVVVTSGVDFDQQEQPG